MNDLEVLEFIGRQGKEPEQVADRFPGFDMQRVVRAGLIRLHRIELAETTAPGAPPTPDPTYYVLTPRGAEAIGLDPRTLHAPQHERVVTEYIPWITAITAVVGIVFAGWRVYVERERKKVLREQLKQSERRAELALLDLHPTGGGGNAVTFTAYVQNLGTRPTRATVHAHVNNRDVTVHPSTTAR